jgi:hypothetical protein
VHALRNDRALDTGSTAMDRQGDDKGERGSRSRAVARLSTLQRLRDDALAKNRQSMLKSIEDMIASEMRALQASGSEGDGAAQQDGKAKG